MLITALAGFLIATAACATGSAATWVEQVQAWRATREADLRKPDGWLAVSGLHFLPAGITTVGAAPTADLQLPAGSAPAQAGRFISEAGHVRFEAAAGVHVTLNGQAITGPVPMSLADAKSARPADRLQIGRISLLLHQSGARLAVRLRDPESPYRTNFTGLRWFPIDKAWRIPGRLIRYETPRHIDVQNILGDSEPMISPGEVEAVIDGTPVRLAAVQAARGRLWLIFSDATASDLTYRVRFLYTDAPDADGAVDLDFNRAYNPPCAFNPHTTCPLPPRQNRLPVRITAGEQQYSGHTQTTAN